MIAFILDRWRTPYWMPPFPNLLFHVVHMTGGAAVVLLLIGGGLAWFDAALLVSMLFIFIEFVTWVLTPKAKKNPKDCTFDAWQYQAHWIAYCLTFGIEYAGAALGVFLVGYFWMLLKGW